MENNNMRVLMIIINAGFSEEAMEIARSLGATGGTIINARGTSLTETVILGAHVGPQKEMIISVVTESVANKIMDEIKLQKGVDSPANGICFSLPIDNVTHINKID